MNTWQRDSGLLVPEDLVKLPSGLLVQAGTDKHDPPRMTAANAWSKFVNYWEDAIEEDLPPEPQSPMSKHYEANPMDWIRDDIFTRQVMEGLRQVIGPPASPCNHHERGMHISVCEGCNSPKPDQTA